MDGSPSGSSVHRMILATVLEFGCHFLLQEMCLTSDWTWISCDSWIGRWTPTWATWEVLGKGWLIPKSSSVSTFILKIQNFIITLHQRYTLFNKTLAKAKFLLFRFYLFPVTSKTKNRLCVELRAGSGKTDFFLLVARLNSQGDSVENHWLKSYAFICLKRSNCFLQFQIIK